jgi:hypothetical protein
MHPPPPSCPRSHTIPLPSTVHCPRAPSAAAIEAPVWDSPTELQISTHHTAHDGKQQAQGAVHTHWRYPQSTELLSLTRQLPPAHSQETQQTMPTRCISRGCFTHARKVQGAHRRGAGPCPSHNRTPCAWGTHAGLCAPLYAATQRVVPPAGIACAQPGLNDSKRSSTPCVGPNTPWTWSAA